jgi:hypothetical protein
MFRDELERGSFKAINASIRNQPSYRCCSQKTIRPRVVSARVCPVLLERPQVHLDLVYQIVRHYGSMGAEPDKGKPENHHYFQTYVGIWDYFQICED